MLAREEWMTQPHNGRETHNAATQEQEATEDAVLF